MAAGKFDYGKVGSGQADLDHDLLKFSEDSLELSVKKGEIRKGSFTVFASGEAPAEGRVYSSEIKMQCLTREFIGKREEIAYRFDSEGMEEGDVWEGYFTILSNYGEYEIPYKITMETEMIASSLGEIRNMFHFANLAKANWEEAVKVFYSKEFQRIFSRGGDKQYYCAYKGLSAVYGNERNVEEFLLETNKKQKVAFSTDQAQIRLDDMEGVSEHSVIVMRNGWGYTFLHVEAEGDFIAAEKERVTDHDFLGNSCRIVYYVDSGRLHAGRNYGSLHIYNSYTDIRIPITVRGSMKAVNALGFRKEKKRILVQLMEYYCNYRGRKITAKTWMGETEKLVEKLVSLDTKDVQTRLFAVQLLLTQDRNKEAARQLERLKEEGGVDQCAPEISCYYLYLNSLLSEDEEYVDRTTQQVEKVYRMNPGNWRIAWLMLHLSEEYVKSPSKRWLVLEEQFRQGCVSPVLYVEAWHLLEVNPTLLMKMGAFEMQVLRFAARRELLTEDVVVQIRYQVQKLKGYSPHVFYILKECYEKYPDRETLQAICTLLIKGNETDSRFFGWYRLGVEAELRITKLYEYFMMALPEEYEGEIPRMVLMYFAYQSDLDYRKNAFLYAYIYKRREEHPEYYIKFCTQIDEFVQEQLQKGRINKDLAYLYQSLILGGKLDEEQAKALLPLLFTYRIQTDNKEIHQAVVCYAISRKEYRFPLNGGRAYLPLYGEDYKVFLEDGAGYRYTVSVPCRMERLMEPGNLADEAAGLIPEHEGLDIYLCEKDHAFQEITEGNESRFRHIAASENIENDRRNEVCLKLLHYYYERDYMLELDRYLEELEPEGKNSRERNEMIRFLVMRGMWDKALAWTEHFGIQGIDGKILMRLCSRLIARDGFLEDEDLTKIVYYVFGKGKYDANILSYLVNFYHGTMGRMRDVWKAASEFEVDTYELCERILTQMMGTGSYAGEQMEIFRTYVAGGAKSEVETAFLTHCSYDFFIKGKPTEPYVFTDMLRVHERGERMKKVCRLAFLQYYAEHKEERTPGVKAAAREFLRDLLKEEACFAFYKDYMEEVPELEEFEDKAVVEYKTSPGSKVFIHYMIEKGAHTQKGYRQEEMKDMYGGVYAKPFVLFFGEKLQYYISEEKYGREQVTESASLSRSDSLPEDAESRYALINDIVAAQVLQDYDTVDQLLADYYKKEYMVSRVFRLK